MLALVRAAPKSAPRLSNSRLSVRAFAEVVRAPSSSQEPLSGSPLAVQSQKNNLSISQVYSGSQQVSKDRIPVREDHGLYGFFRRKDGADLIGDARFEVVETPERMQHATGRGWKASELRLKSFEDLHTLWYILLRERNLLATQKEEVRRMGVTDTGRQVSLDRVHQCRKSMARIKAVINERRLAYEGAVRLVERQREQHQDNIVLQHQVIQYRKERKYLQRRRLFMERKNAERQLMRRAHESTTQEMGTNPGPSETTDPKTTSEVKDETSEKPASIELSLEKRHADILSKQATIQQEAEPAASQVDAKNGQEQTLMMEKGEVQTEPPKRSLASTSSNPVDATTAGLFGAVQVGKSPRRR
ncbi:mitochondrial 39-S ribosomal protein L47 (MRP-L47)-domain-containing protein [Collybia nuda]|uniref:Large ribosomal subunit protein uL29m n=1 Tax=Collybia nuda TaxID=64659 RepID=A0A9P5Y5G0_9AGAR|nr:mitochondrial 39-S ribosomal protein L47 (MRP-L47)-domain-containing protein [Collybia nuda]